MELLLNTLLDLSLNRAVMTHNPLEFAKMTNIAKFTIMSWQLERVIENMKLRFENEMCNFSSLMTEISNEPFKSEEKSNSASREKILLPTEDSLPANFQNMRKNKINLQRKVESFLCSNDYPVKNVGKFSPALRLRKILTYKMKKILKRETKPVSRRFTGRSSVAKKKLRFRGRFVKKDTIVKKTLFKVIHSKSKKRFF